MRRTLASLGVMLGFGLLGIPACAPPATAAAACAHPIRVSYRTKGYRPTYGWRWSCR